ncbi:MAG: hypothetical protein ACI9DJ_002252 [Algoriphagus sp.]|jgi:hypothetical protein
MAFSIIIIGNSRLCNGLRKSLPLHHSANLSLKPTPSEFYVWLVGLIK